MSEDRSSLHGADPRAGPAWIFPILLLLFAGSGCAALIYEIIWFQLLELIIGSSAVSLGILLGTFMGGMCVGALIAPRIITAHRHPFRVYAILETGIALFGALILFGLPVLGDYYVGMATSATASLFLRALLCVLALLGPTICMGATLPVIARWLRATPSGAAALGYLYSANIVGGVIGALVAGFYLLREYDVAIATTVAVLLNLLVAVAAFLVARRSGHRQLDETQGRSVIAEVPGAKRVYWAIGLSGMSALGAQVVWTRLLSLSLGATVYTFSLILAVVLIGMGIGSAAGSATARRTRHPDSWLGWCQLLLPVAMAWAAFLITRSLPFWPVDPTLRTSVWHAFEFDLWRCAWSILPATTLWGASFPLAIAATTVADQDPGRVTARIYVANTAGAIVGALGFSLFVIPLLGTQTAQRLLILIAAIAGIVLLVLPLLQIRGHATDRAEARRRTVLAFGVLIAIPLAVSVGAVPAGFIGYGRLLATRFPPPLAAVVVAGGFPILGAAVISIVMVLGVMFWISRKGAGPGSLSGADSIPLLASQATSRHLIWTAIAAAGLVLGMSYPSQALARVLGHTNDSLGVTLIVTAGGVSIGFWLVRRLALDPERVAALMVRLICLGLLWLGATWLLLTYSLPAWPITPSLAMSSWMHLQLFLMPAAVLLLPPAVTWTAALVLSTRGIQGRRSAASIVTVGAAGGLASAIVVVVLSGGANVQPTGLVHGDAFAAVYSPMPRFVFTGEGINSSIAVSEEGNGSRSFHVSGKIEASSKPQDMRLQRMLGHLSALVQGHPKSVLIVGFGAGVTAGSFVTYPGIERIVICELEPLIPKSIGPYFAEQNYHVLEDPRVSIVYDDARHFIRTTREKFDVITSDPIHPWVRGAATLYTEEYFNFVREHLNPGGVATQWVPLYESRADAVKSELATFFRVFPDGTIWANNAGDHGYDLVVLGQVGPTVIDIPALQETLGTPSYAAIGSSLQDVGFYSLVDLFGNFAGDAQGVANWLADAAINHDSNLRLQYLAGLGNNSYEQAAIYDSIVAPRVFPERLFRAPSAWKDSLSNYMQVRRVGTTPSVR